MNQHNTNQAPAPAPFKRVVMRLNKRQQDKNGKMSNVFDKHLPYWLPTLNSVSAALPEPDRWESKESKESKDGEEVVEIAVPVYEDAILQYVQEALTQRIQGLARSRDSAGQPVCTNWEEIAECGSGAKYPTQLKHFREGFAEWLKEVSPYSDLQAAAIMAYTDTKRLMLQTEERKAKFADVVSEYIQTLDTPAEFGSVISAINKAISTQEEDLDW